MVGITSEEEDTSESFSRIGMPKNGSLFMCDGASWSTVVEEGELVDSAGSGATTSAIGAMTSGAGSSSKLICVVLLLIPTTSKTKCRKPRRSKQPFSLEESPVDTMADQRTMAELLRAPTEGYAEAIVVPPILAEHFELKHSLINMMTSDQFFRLEKDNPYDHIPKLTHAVNQQTSVVTTAMTAILKQFQATPPPASVKAVEEICVTCSGSHPYYQCPFRRMATLSAYFQQPAVKLTIRAIIPVIGLRTSPPEVVLFLMDLPFLCLLHSLTRRKDERVEETLTDPELAEYTIKVPPPLVQKAKPTSLRNYVVHQRDPRHPHIPYPSRMNQEKQQEKDEVQIHKFWQMFKQLHVNISLADALILILKYQKMIKSLLSNIEKLYSWQIHPSNENCSTVILKKLPEKLGDPGKFLILCGFSELKCKALADLANQSICTPAGIARDVFVPVRKFTFPADFVIVDYESDPRVPLILGRPFLRTARALIDDYLEDLFATNHLSGNPTFSSHTDLTSPKVINPLSGSTTSSSPDHLLEEFADGLALITFPPGNDDLPFDIESDLREIEYLLNHDPTKEMDSLSILNKRL
ncbi:reverse transcriptase domain-containing protein [Tanacetum coccineum]|uniref:Reverse transcriptase domain-containing protein n=1 Tax=Tanacetum coccineum TaxID=301880 RepID=A0ABQ4ZMH8_9ASTR